MKKLSILILFLLPLLCSAQTQVAPFLTPNQQFLDSSGNPLAGGKVCTFAAGSSTPLASYSESTGTTPNANPIVLDSSGRATIFLTSAAYKIIVAASTASSLCSPAITTTDNVTWNNLAQTLSTLTVNGNITQAQPTAATSGANQSSFTTCIQSSYWNGSASATDKYCFQDVLGTGANPASTLAINHTGSATNTVLFNPSVTFGSQILASDGSASLPGISFSAEPGTGFARLTPVQVAIIVSGFGNAALVDNTGLRISSSLPIGWSSAINPFGNPNDTGLSRCAALVVCVGNGANGNTTGTFKGAVASLGDGSVSLPALTFTGATNMGLYRYTASGNNDLGLGVGATDAVRISQSLGQVIINSTWHLAWGSTGVGAPDSTIARSAAKTFQFGTGGDATGTIKAATVQLTSQLQSTIATGTAPLTVTSTTPVTNLTASPLLYNASGTQQVNPHGVKTDVTLDGGGNGTLTLTGASVFTSSSTWRCSYSDQSGANSVQITYSSGSAASLLGTAAHAISLLCWGT